MPFDKFTPCPCGSGKKAKFCCSKDLIHELEAIDRMMTGDQRLAALQRIDQLLESHPDLPCLLSLKAEAHLHLNEWEKVHETASRMIVKQADNARSHAFLAVAAAAMDNPEQGIEHLQDAADLLRDNSIDPYTLQAFVMVGSALQSVGALAAARGHLVFYTVVAGRSSEPASAPLTRFDSSPRIPLLIKYPPEADAPAETSPIAADYESAIKLVGQGRFRAAADELRKLAEKSPKEPAVLVHLATQLGWLNRGEEAAEYWRRYSLLSSTDPETAVEAEALAQIISDQPLSDAIGSTLVTYQVESVDGLLERAAPVDRLVRAPVDPQALVDEGEPPPRAAFLFLDRPPQKDGAPLQRDQLPLVVGELLVFGRQTDRPPRLEFIAGNAADAEPAAKQLLELVGPLEEIERQELGTTSTWLTTQLFPRWYLPEQVSQEQSQHFVAEQARQTMLEKWPRQPSELLKGKSPNEAAADFHLRLPVEALILRLEMDDLQSLVGFDFNELRRKLDLPERGPLDPTQSDVRQLPLIRAHRLETSKLTDEQLLLLFQRAQIAAALRALRRLGTEIVARESLNARLDKNGVFRLLVQISATSEEAVELIRQAKGYAQSKGESPAQWLLVEMNLCIQRGDVNQVQQIMQTLQTKHLREPGVAEAVYQFLMAVGAIGPDGQPVGPAMEASAAPAASGGIWTPGSSAPASEGKSKLWVPGMD